VLAPEICWTNRAKNGGTVGEGTDFGLGLDMLIRRLSFNRMSDRLSGPID
jgi:hypothetical protein